MNHWKILLAGGSLALLGATHAGAATIAISCDATLASLCEEAGNAWGSKTGNEVQVVVAPPSMSAIMSLYLNLFGAGSPDLDVVMVDVIWPALLSDHLVDLTPFIPADYMAAQLDVMRETYTIGGKVIALPEFADFGTLIYRKDLLEKYGKPIPETWKELGETAASIQTAEREAGNKGMWGYVFHAAADEGLTCEAVEWLHSYGAAVLDDSGNVVVDDPKAVAALSVAASWIDTISPRGVLNYGEEDARNLFQSGNAVFMRNWPYAFTLGDQDGSAVKGKIGITILPKGDLDDQHAAALGGNAFGVSKYSKHTDIAADFVLFLTSQAEQRKNAIDHGYNPTWKSLYDDPDVLNASPVFKAISRNLSNLVARPSRQTGDKYNEVTTAIWTAASSVISGSVSAEQGAADLDTQLEEIKGQGW